MSLLNLYDSWFPPIRGAGKGILRPLIWISTTFPLVLVVFVSVFCAGLLVPWPNNGWGGLISLILLFASVPISLWCYRKFVEYLKRDAIKVGVLTHVNLAVLPVVFTWLYYGNHHSDISDPIKWYLVILILFASGAVVFFLGKIHRASFLEDKVFSNSTLTLFEKLVSGLTGLAVPGWIMMHFRYINNSFYGWLFLLVLPVMLFIGLMPIFMDVFYNLTHAFVDWDNLFSNFKAPGLWGLISITYVSWGLVVYAMERHPVIRKTIMAIIFLSLSAFSIITHFTEPEYADASLGEAIFVNLGVIVLILLGCFVANEAVKKNLSPEINISGTNFGDVETSKSTKQNQKAKDQYL